MQPGNATKRRCRQFQQLRSNGAGNDRLALVNDRALRDLVVDLDGVYDALTGSALSGNGGYELAATVPDYLINLRLSAAR
jgi:hypothetical protein